jgi:hypothetical protein
MRWACRHAGDLVCLASILFAYIGIWRAATI